MFESSVAARRAQDTGSLQYHQKRSKTVDKCVICGKEFKFGSDADDIEEDGGPGVVCGQCVRDADAEQDDFDPEAEK